ncbi:SusD/RagB family nutrient-binding outer membrane lipoprotein [Danxiaibacter flavus]|uniref:SusD/RagB family nutrient-binding outer membrane lipoprotein n=1 Tax=Danxiaibacter flavus TaxID=3049108 RepID=A0ABV3ZK85_9BACT|nr:SusD/RagB family nutrient-binding outer membrane lipoprotein [Chitinophagaceae bacterium DXS]
MRKSISTYIILAVLAVTAGTLSSCKKNFGEMNTNPAVVTTPDIKFLLSYSEDRLVTYQGTEWVWESMEQLWRFTQHITSSPYEITNNVNTRYSNYYQQILPNLFEIRRQIDMKTDKESYQKMGAVTLVLQILHGIKVTDMNGSIPYSQAEQGRYENNFSPVYDDQQTLFNTWLSQLDSSIAILSNSSLPTQQSYGNSDIFYKGDFTKWVKLANTLKLRIAARLENQDATKTKAIFQEVMKDATGPIDSDDAQVSYSSVDYLPFGTSGDINYRSIRYASTSIVNFLKAANDPRIQVYFEPNDLQGSFKDTLAAYNATLPAFINPNDPLVRFQGGPADWTTDPARASYLSNAYPVGPYTKYFLISKINRKFFSPRMNGATDGQFTDVIVTNAESCLLVAEFIQKGYGSGVDTRGTAEDWYKKGITSSIKTMNQIAVTANSTTAYSGDGLTVIADYLNQPMVKFNGVNDLERIYIQEYLNAFRNINEGYVLCRRTGYPKLSSTYYPRETFNETIPRRFWTTDPGEVNRANWNAALQAQGFTPLAQDVQTLNTERIWYDKNAPDFGKGN